MCFIGASIMRSCNYREIPFKVSELFYAPSGAVVGSRLEIEFVVGKFYNYDVKKYCI
jgi:hypothetical protein